MNRLLATCTLAFAACLAPQTMIPTEGAVQRQVARVVVRHDAYVQMDPALDELDRAAFLQQSAISKLMVDTSVEVSADALNSSLSPVLDRHDTYVQADSALDPVERDTYLKSTEGLRSLIAGLISK